MACRRSTLMLSEIEQVALSLRVPARTARQYLEMAGDAAGILALSKRALQRSPSGALASLPNRYAMDLMIAAGGVEEGLEWVEVHIRPEELAKAVLFDPTPVALWADVVEVARVLSPRLTAHEAAAMVRGCNWSGMFPAHRVLEALDSDIPWEYLLVMSLD